MPRPPSVHSSSRADVWYLKDVVFRSQTSHRRLKIITQNFNGPCSFIALCNILVLRGQIQILPPDRTTVSYELLAQLVGEYLLNNCPDVDISAALSIMPSTTKGLDLNPQFTSVTAFSPASDAGELALFAQAGIQLVHGWVVDPDSPEADVITQIRDYDTAVTLIADADYITKGRLLGGDAQGSSAADEPDPGPSSASTSAATGAGVGTFPARPHTSQYSDQDQRKIEQAIVAQQFLDATQSQLTYHGLFQLASTLEPGSLVALFRNAHLSVVYKSPSSRPSTGSTQPQPSGASEAHANPDPGTETDAHLNPARDRDANTDTHTTLPPQPPQDSALYALVTDDVFLHEPSIVWERLEDVDGGAAWFVDADFHPSVPIGGDVAGQTAEGALRQLEIQAGLGVVDPADHALAKQMQDEEDARARELYMRRQQALAQRRRAEAEEAERQRRIRTREEERKEGSMHRGRSKRGKNCVIM